VGGMKWGLGLVGGVGFPRRLAGCPVVLGRARLGPFEFDRFFAEVPGMRAVYYVMNMRIPLAVASLDVTRGSRGASEVLLH